jgi:hypothetical protein
VQVFILKMVSLSQKQVFASPFLRRSRLQLLVMVSVWFDRLAVPVAERRSGPRSRPLFATPDEGTWADIGSANGQKNERRRGSFWLTDIPDYSTVSTICQKCVNYLSHSNNLEKPDSFEQLGKGRLFESEKPQVSRRFEAAKAHPTGRLPPQEASGRPELQRLTKLRGEYSNGRSQEINAGGSESGHFPRNDGSE